MRCSKCGADNREGRKFCAECAAPLIATCAKCGTANEPREKFCGECGAVLPGSAEPVSAQPLQTPSGGAAIRATSEAADAQAEDAARLEGERKTVTALFADIKGSTELMRDVDPEVARAIVDPALKIMIDAVRSYDGYVVQSTGDGIFALFGAPLAHEDHAQRALYSALRVQEGLWDYAARLTARDKPPVEARVGLHSGEVVMRAVETGGRVEYTPVGYVTNLAARMQTAAPAGGIAISEETRRLVEGYVELRALGLTEIKGVAGPINVYEVTGLGALRTHFDVSARRGLTRFVGRERELTHMQGALELAIGGHGQVVAIVAEAGAGKSRLVYEFKAVLPSGCKLLEAYSVSYGKASAWLPVLELLRAYFGIETTDDTATRREKVRTTVEALDPGLNDTLPYLWGLLGIQETPDPLAQMDPQIRQRRTRDAIKRIIVQESRVQPTMVIFEDLHSIDSETQALLDFLVDSIANAKVLLLVNYRPDYRHQWANKSYYLQLRLDPLGRESTSEILAALLGESAEFDALKHMMIERTQGNPFFIEEMVQALFDEGALVRNGTVKIMRPLAQLRMPPTVQGILAARIDRLPREEKDLLQTLAVVGREAPLALIRAIVKKPAIDRMLGNLQSGEFIYEQAAKGGIEYTFKHALTQEVAYKLILSNRREALHDRVGHALESLFASQLDDYLDKLAHHYSHSADHHKAVQYLRLAAQQAVSRGSFTQAITQLKEAVELLGKLPPDRHTLGAELATQLALAGTLVGQHGRRAPAEDSFLRARAIAGQLGDYDAQLHAMLGLRVVYRFRQEYEKSRLLAEEALATAEAHRPEVAGSAHFGLAETLLFSGEIEQALHHYEEARSLGNPVRAALTTDARPLNLVQCALARWILGYPEQASELSRQASNLALSHGDIALISIVVQFSGWLHQWSGDVAMTMREAEELLKLSDARGSTFFSAIATTLRGWALAKRGRPEEGLLEMRQALAAAAEAGWSSRTVSWGRSPKYTARVVKPPSGWI
jgi:class 3 adenylate cyclase/tetratricopeptide (TPR) repeat protein